MIKQAKNVSFDHSYMEVDTPRDEPPSLSVPSAPETGVPDNVEVPPAHPEERRQCRVCKRSFYAQLLTNHVRICQKITSKTRTVFNSRAMRAVGTPIANFVPSRPPPPEGPKKSSNWRRSHERLIANIRAKKDNSQPPPSHAFNYSDNNSNRYGARYSGNNAYGDVHLRSRRANARRTPQEAIQLAHNT